MPSATPLETQPFVATASPQAAQVAEAITSNVMVMIDQRVELITAFEHNLVSIVKTVGQVISQEVAALERQVDSVLGFNANSTNTSLSTALTQSNSHSGAGRGNSSGAGHGSGALTASANAQNQTLNSSIQQSGRGSGSGSSATTDHALLAKSGVTTALTPGSGSYGSGTAGSGTGSIGSGIGSEGAGIVSGNVWLDNNGDGSWDNGELGYQGITVELFLTSTAPWTLEATTTTVQYGRYSFSLPLGPGAEPFLVHVQLGALNATYPGSQNQINNNGNSLPFNLREGGWRKILAGLLSMSVTTTQDDPNGPIQNQMTLRDAIQTGNNGGGPLHLTNIRFWNNVQGTIALQKALDPIKRSYNIVGPGSSTLAVQGGGANNPFRIFTINAGVTSEISGLTIKNGYVSDVGGGILNYGVLDCRSCSVVNNQANNGWNGNGGGIANLGGTLNLLGNTKVSGNTASGYGGGIYMTAGKVTASTAFSGTTVAINNNTASIGGGIYVYTGSLKLEKATTVSSNKATGAYGGGIAMLGGTATISRGAIWNNSALNGGGGGIWILGARLTLKDEMVADNSANTNGGGIAMAGGKTVAGGTAIISGGSIQHNTAGNSGGGIYNVAGALLLGLNNNDATVNDNGANNQGGGLYLATPSRTTFNGCLVSGNSANTGKGVYRQNNATLFGLPRGLTDDDDPGGTPVTGA